MSAFEQALAAQAQPQATTSAINIRGQGTGAPSARGFGSALRQAGMKSDSRMEVEGEGGRPVRGQARRSSARSGGPMDQSGRHRPSNIPYAKPPNDRDLARPRGTLPPNGPASTLASRLSRPQINPNGKPGRQPQGTPPLLRRDLTEAKKAQASAHSSLSEKLGGEEMKQWLRSRVIGDGIMDMSGLPSDPWLKQQGILPPSDVNAPHATGSILWKLIDTVIQRPTDMPVHTLSLSNNSFVSLVHLARLPFNLPHLRALDLSNNPIRQVQELDHLLAQGEKKGKATAGVGSLKSLIELKLNDCAFREKMIAEANGAETYQRETLRRFPGLLILDGVNLNRIVFDGERKPQVRRTPDERTQLATAKPFSFPADVQGGFVENEVVRSFVMSFCAKFFPLFDTDRNSLIPAYSPTATISTSANTLIARSHLGVELQKNRHLRPQPVAFDPWVKLPARNLLRNAQTTEARMATLKHPGDGDDLMDWWRRIPVTRHPLGDPGKWCVDAWVLDGEGVETKLCAMIQGEFEEMPSGSYRSFSRTFILADAPQGSPAQLAGWPATILSDTFTVHPYLSSAAFNDKRSLATNGVVITPPTPSTTPSGTNTNERAEVITRLRNATRMNEQFAVMCLEQNGWGYEEALANFEGIKASIPPEAFV